MRYFPVGAKILTFRQIHNAIITLPRGGCKLHWQLRWGAKAGLTPLHPQLTSCPLMVYEFAAPALRLQGANYY